MFVVGVFFWHSPYKKKGLLMENNVVVTTSDLNKKSRSLAIQDNMSLIPMTAGLTTAGMFFALDLFVLLYVSLGVATVGIGLLFVNLSLRKEHFQQIFMKKHNEILKEENRKKLIYIKESLKNKKSSKQIERFDIKYELFKKVIKNQLSESSLAYQRLVGGFDQIYLMATKNIEKVLNYEINMDAIDIKYIGIEIKKLENKSQLESYEELELSSLKERLELFNDYKVKIDEILSNNEVALTKMDKTQASLTELNKPESMRCALQELQMLANVLDNKTSRK
jgi:NhaP-type Na+/H+ and K+/H+ antiporter